MVALISWNTGDIIGCKYRYEGPATLYKGLTSVPTAGPLDVVALHVMHQGTVLATHAHAWKSLARFLHHAHVRAGNLAWVLQRVRVSLARFLQSRTRASARSVFLRGKVRNKLRTDAKHSTRSNYLKSLRPTTYLSWSGAKLITPHHCNYL